MYWAGRRFRKVACEKWRAACREGNGCEGGNGGGRPQNETGEKKNGTSWEREVSRKVGVELRGKEEISFKSCKEGAETLYPFTFVWTAIINDAFGLEGRSGMKWKGKIKNDKKGKAKGG